MLSQWEIENLLTGGILGILLIMYADTVYARTRANRIQGTSMLAQLHLVVITLCGMALLAKLLLALIGV